MLKIRRPLGRLIFNMGIAIPGKTVFLIETAPWVSINSGNDLSHVRRQAISFTNADLLSTGPAGTNIGEIQINIQIISGSTIMAQVRDIKISDALNFPGIFTPLTYMLQMEWFLMDNTLTNVSVRFHDYGPSKGH